MIIFTTTKKLKRAPLRRKRQGLSLIEVVVMASVTSAMLVMATGWIHQTMKQSSRFRIEHREQLAFAKLSQHFRKHVWQSETADTSDPNSISLTNQQGHSFKYSLKDQQLDFVHRNASGALQSMERFVLPAFSKATFGQNDDSAIMMKIESSIGVQTATAESRKPASRTSLVVESTLARWLQVSKSTSFNSEAQSRAEGDKVPK